MRALSVLSLLAVSACASSSGSSPQSAVETVRVEGAGNLRINASTSEAVATFVAPLDRVWRALPVAYEAVGVPVTMVDPATHRLGNEGFKIRQTIAKAPLSRYLDCGNSQGFPNADSYEVQLTVMSRAAPGDAGSTKVTTVVDASARPINYRQSFTRCTTKGALEAKIAEVVKEQLQR